MSFFRNKKYAKENGEDWLVVSDLMTGLMIIFMFISIIFMFEKQKESQEINNAMLAFQENKQAIYLILQAEFGENLKDWNANIDKETLSFNFQAPEKLFISPSMDLTPYFRRILSDFFPRYVKILEPYQDILDEVRIEGHTSTYWSRNSTKAQAYLKNMRFSQIRTREMLRFIYSLEPKETDWVKKNVVAIGFSSSQAVKENGVENTYLSRRVSIRAVLNMHANLNEALDKALNEPLKEMNEANG